jgi:hypothetical protein
MTKPARHRRPSRPLADLCGVMRLEPIEPLGPGAQSGLPARSAALARRVWVSQREGMSSLGSLVKVARRFWSIFSASRHQCRDVARISKGRPVALRVGPRRVARTALKTAFLRYVGRYLRRHHSNEISLPGSCRFRADLAYRCQGLVRHLNSGARCAYRVPSPARTSFVASTPSLRWDTTTSLRVGKTTADQLPRGPTHCPSIFVVGQPTVESAAGQRSLHRTVAMCRSCRLQARKLTSSPRSEEDRRKPVDAIGCAD